MDVSPEKQQQVLAKIDVNIKMFSGYRKTDHVVCMLERLHSNRAELVEYFEGRKDKKDVSWPALEWTFEIPDWGTYGT